MYQRYFRKDLWKFCTTEDCREMILSFRLLGRNDWTDEKVMACLYALSNHQKDHYRAVRLSKRNGGFRTLLVPDPLLKYVQKNILHHVLDGFEPAPSASAYHKGASAVLNARIHSGKHRVVKLDLKDFFDSITFSMVQQSAFPGWYFPPQVQALLTALCCSNDRLPQGAPTSPAISNLVLKHYDLYMEKWCGERDITYSRYCDDMTFSGDFSPALVIRKASGFLQELGFELNTEKTKILSTGCRQIVTGIVVNEKPQLCRDYRRKLRQEFYYCQRFGVESHLKKIYGDEYFSGELAERSGRVRRYLESLLGKLRYVLLVNPEDKKLREAAEKVALVLMEDIL